MFAIVTEEREITSQRSCWQAGRGRTDWHAQEHSEAGWPSERGRMKYTVIFEKGPSSYGAYVPDLPGCVAVGESREEVERLIREAVEFHIEGLREDGLTVPEPASTAGEIDVPVQS